MLIEDKHSISVLTEEVLYRRIKAFDESDNFDENTKKEKKEEAIEFFIKEYTEKSTSLSEEEVRKIVHSVLKRTIDNIKHIKENER